MSNDGYGMTGHLGLSFQDSFGTSLVTSMDYFPIISESLTDDIADLVSEGMRGRFEEGASYEGEHSVAGDIVFEMHPILAGKIFKAWAGQSSSTQQSSVYEHRFVPRTQDFDTFAAVPPMSLEVYRDAGSAYLFYDMLCNELTLEIAAGGLWRATMAMVGGQVSTLAKTAPSYEAGSEYTWDVTSISIAGVAVNDMSGITWKGLNSLEPKSFLNGSKFPGQVKRTGYRSIEISGTVIFTDDAEYQIYRARTQQQLLINVSGQSITVSQGTDINIDVPQMLYTAYPPNISGMAQIEVGFTGKAKFDETSNYMGQITLINTRDAY